MQVALIVMLLSQGDRKQIDVTELALHRKRVRPVTLQHSFESRRLWQNVTDALLQNDVEEATKHKRFVRTTSPLSVLIVR